MKSNWLDKLERKFGKFAIPQLTTIVIITYVIGYLLNYMGYMPYIAFNPYLVVNNLEIWRVFTWVFMPPGRLGLFTIIMLFFYFSIGQALERTWGDFRYNMYLFSGIIFMIIGSFATYFAGIKIMGLDELSAYAFGWEIAAYTTTFYINTSLFLAFAASYPDMQVLLYFIVPIKVVWLAVLDIVFIIWDMIEKPWYGRVMIIVSLLNFVLFYFSTRNLSRIRPSEMHRRKAYRRSVNRGSGGAFQTYDGGLNRENSPDSKNTGNFSGSIISKHHCAVCGRTELTNPELEFRFCSKCNGNYEYCMDHLYTHTHVE